MNSDLEEVIGAYEVEKEALEKQIADYVKEADYLYAHYHQRALRKVNQTLNTLKNLQNPLYRRVSEQQMYIDNYKRLLVDIGNSGNEYLNRRLSEHENKIQI